MNCRLWEERIALYQGGDLPAGQMAEVERHLADCAGCQLLASGLKEALEVLRASHADVPADAYFTAVRARVLAEVEKAHRPVWRRVLALGQHCSRSAVEASLRPRRPSRRQRNMTINVT